MNWVFLKPLGPATQIKTPGESSAASDEEFNPPEERPISKRDYRPVELSSVERPDRPDRRRTNDDDEPDDDLADDVPVGNHTQVSSEPLQESEIPMATTFKQVKSEWDAALTEKLKQMPHVKSMADVIRVVVKEQPLLHQRLIEAANRPKPIAAASAKTELYRRVKSDWDGKLAAKRQACPHLSWDQVVAAVCKENRALREQLVTAANA